MDGSDGLVDLETAAALMTELHHAAAAAAMMDQQEELQREKKSRRSMSSDFDPSMPYTPGAIPVCNLSWDPPTPSSSTGPDFSRGPESQDWNASTLQLPSGHPTSMERSFSAEPPRSYAASPNPYFTGCASPSGLPAHSTPPPTPPSVDSDDERNMVLDNIREIDIERAVLGRFRLPSKSGLNRYLTAYFNLFHHHLPFLHMATFKPGSMAPPLLLAVLSVGALYTFEKEQA